MPTTSPSGTCTVDPDQAAQLLIDIRNGHTETIDDLIRLCEPLVRRNAQRYAWTRNQVDDVVQEVWMLLMVHASRIDDPQALLAWLHTVTRRTASHVGHREARFVPTEQFVDEPGLSCTEDEALSGEDRGEAHRVVTNALEQLNGRDQHLLLLLHGDRRPGYQSISRAVNRPVGSLGPTRQRLLRRLRRDAQITQHRDAQMA